jgi:hypothetical protein
MHLTNKFEVLRRELERRLEEGCTFQELAAMYKMDKKIRK